MLCAPGLSSSDYEGVREKLLRAKNGDKQAREELVRENLPLVHYVLRRFRDRGAEYEDLYQYGCMGLVKAVDRFDPSFDVRFSTYAVPVIMGEVRRYLRDSGAVHISRTIHENAARVEKFRQSYLQENGDEASLETIARETGLSREDVILAANAGQRVRSLNETVGPEGSARLMDVLGEDSMQAVDRRILLAEMLKELSQDERTIIIRRYFRANTQSEIAKDMGISQVQVSRLESRILKRMREHAADGG